MPTHLIRRHAPIRLELTPHGLSCRVFVDGVDVTDLASIHIITVEASVDGLTEIRVGCYALGGVTVEGIAGVLRAEVETEADLRPQTVTHGGERPKVES